jgi:hypothetical protein
MSDSPVKYISLEAFSSKDLEDVELRFQFIHNNTVFFKCSSLLVFYTQTDAPLKFTILQHSDYKPKLVIDGIQGSLLQKLQKFENIFSNKLKSALDKLEYSGSTFLSLLEQKEYATSFKLGLMMDENNDFSVSLSSASPQSGGGAEKHTDTDLKNILHYKQHNAKFAFSIRHVFFRQHTGVFGASTTVEKLQLVSTEKKKGEGIQLMRNKIPFMDEN